MIPEHVEQAWLSVLKAAAARDVLEAVVQGRLRARSDVLTATAALVTASAHHAELAERVAA